MLDDGITLQMAIGGVPDVVYEMADGLKDIGIHTEMLSDVAMRVIERVIVTGLRKTLHHGKVAITFIRQRLHGARVAPEWLHRDRLPEERLLPNKHFSDEPLEGRRFRGSLLPGWLPGDWQRTNELR